MRGGPIRCCSYSTTSGYQQQRGQALCPQRPRITAQLRTASSTRLIQECRNLLSSYVDVTAALVVEAKHLVLQRFLYEQREARQRQGHHMSEVSTESCAEPVIAHDFELRAGHVYYFWPSVRDIAKRRCRYNTNYANVTLGAFRRSVL